MCFKEAHTEDYQVPKRTGLGPSEEESSRTIGSKNKDEERVLSIRKTSSRNLAPSQGNQKMAISQSKDSHPLLDGPDSQIWES